MDVQEITMDPAKAREAFKAYSAAVKQRYNADYDALAKGYKAIAEGKSVIDLHAVLKAAGTDDRARPKLAIARADWEWSYFGRHWIARNWVMVFSADSSPYEHYTRRRVTVSNDCFPGGSLGNYHILCEADWEDVPVDPILLRHLSGALYAVLATWNLSPLERAVMRK
jgi:hypothetical protein